MADLQVENLSKRFGAPDSCAIPAVHHLSLAIQDGELLTLLGPSGCGKTTTLRLISGLETADTGHILLGGKAIEALPARERNVGLIFQRPSLLPQLSVAQNIGLPVKLRRLPNEKALVQQAAADFGLSDLLDRSPATLSGGQAQRVALARALVAQPALLLLDEPLSNLDPVGRVQLRDAIKQILQQTRITALYVTHDQTEAMSLGGRIAIMNRGTLEQTGTVEELYRNPKNLFIAQFFGDGLNLLEEGETVVGFRPSDAMLANEGSVEGKITEVLNLGPHRNIRVSTSAGQIQITCRETPRIGDTVNIQPRPERLLRFDRATGKRL